MRKRDAGAGGKGIKPAAVARPFKSDATGPLVTGEETMLSR
jgi:hypothetical protein